MNDQENLVSIIMPSYNSAEWIQETIESVQSQTYSNWELLITDDASTDNTVQLIQEFQKADNRINLFISRVNRGAGKSRNNSLQHAHGRFIAYLDSDDIWSPNKLERQLAFMSKNHVCMCYTDYDLVGENGEYRRTVHVQKSVTYDGFLKRPLSCSHTIVFDTNVVDKALLVMPDVRRGQDSATWLQVLKTGITGYALCESLAKYRRHEGSLSSNKLKAIKRTWYLYREIEHLPLLYACECFVSYAINAVKKYA